MKKILLPAGLLIGAMLLFTSCDSQEFTSAKMYVQQNDLEQAEQFFLKALEIETTNAEVPFLLAMEVYAKQRRYEDMNAMLDKAMAVNPQQKVGGNTIEELVMNLREVEWTKAYLLGANLYNTAIEQTGGETPGEEETELFKEAMAHFQTAALIRPEEGSSYVNMVYCYRQMGDTEGEQKALTVALEKAPNNETVLLLAGDRYTTDGDYQTAAGYYERASQISPDNVDVLQRLTSIYIELGEPQKALGALEAARKNAPQDPDVYYNLGAVYVNIGNDALQKGQDIYRESVTKEPIPIDQMGEAVAFFKQAQEAYSEALYFMDNTLALNPEDDAAASATREIQSTKKILDTLQRSAEEIYRKGR